MPILRSILVFVCVTAANLLLWQQLGRPVALPDVPNGRFDCLSYTAFEDGSDPTNPEDHVSAATIDADLTALKQITNCIRVYTARGATPTVLEQASRHGMQVLLGIWLGSEPPRNDLEIASALQLLQRYPGTVRTLVVGNEVLLRREMTDHQLAEVIGRVRAQAGGVPVAYADVYDFWVRYPDIAKSVDLILVHLLPYWDDPAPTTEQAQDYLLARLQTFLGYFPGKPVMIGETGWPSAGPARGRAIASVIDEARFVRGFIARAHTLGVSYNLIEALDQPWKRASEGTAGGYWGLLNAARQPKFSLTGPVSAWPDWPLYGAASVALALLLGGLAVWRAQPTMMLPLALIAQLCGTALVLGWHYAAEISLGVAGHVVFYGLWLVALVSGWAVFAVASGGDPARRVSPLSLAALFRCLPDRAAVRDPAVITALLHAAAAIPATVITLVLAVSTRHRDVPWLLLVVPAVLAMALTWRSAPVDHNRLSRFVPIEECVLLLIALSSLVVACLALQSRESLAWAACQLALLLPWLRHCLAWRAAKRRQAGA